MDYEKAKKEVLEIFETLRVAMLANDTVPMKTHVAEDYMGSDAGGNAHGKQMMMDAYGPGGVKLDVFETDDVETRCWDNTVLVLGNVTLNGSYNGEHFEHQSRFMDVYAFRQSHWKLTASTVTDRRM